MIHITDKHNCCGCSACVQICPKKCIGMQEDKEGFLYPLVDLDTCINCGLCEKVCPCINLVDSKAPLQTFAAKNPDDQIRMMSSSGGVFSMLADRILNDGGVVFGVRFNNEWEVVHDYIESQECISLFRGSKYVQSRIGTAYRDAETFLKAGRSVLFSGTPCQVKGLKLYLRKEYDKLLTVDFICHGVPSPGVWRQYLDETFGYPDRREGRGKNTVLSVSKDIPVITGINFRDKKLGWKKFSFVVRGKSAEGGQNSVLLSDIHRKNLYMKAFLRDFIIRPSCYFCPVKGGRSGADITLGDFWGIQNVLPLFDDDKGVSAVLLHSEKGKEYYSKINADSIEVSMQDIIGENPAYIKSVGNNPLREQFFQISTPLCIKQKKFFPSESKIKRYWNHLLNLLKFK